MTNSAIYQGHVAHVRPGKHRLRYAVLMLAIDVDELEQLDKRLHLLAHNRLSLYSVFDRDHGARTGEPVRRHIEALLADADVQWDGGRIVLLTMPRVLNYVFNPLSIYFCFRRDGALAALVHEVSNTFGERHAYVLPPGEGGDGTITQSCEKAFFVSPFLEMGLRYEFRVTPLGGDRAAVAITVRRGSEVALTASFSGERRELTDMNLLRAWLENPLMTFKVIVGIHWEAALMWLKGVRYLGRARPSPSVIAPARTPSPPIAAPSSR